MSKTKANTFQNIILIDSTKKNDVSFGKTKKKPESSYWERPKRKYKKKKQRDREITLPRLAAEYKGTQSRRNVKLMMKAKYKWDSTFFITLCCPDPRKDTYRNSDEVIHPYYYCREYKERLEEFIRLLNEKFIDVGGFWTIEFSKSLKMHFHLLVPFYNHEKDEVLSRRREIFDIWHEINNWHPSLQYSDEFFKEIDDRLGIIEYMAKIRQKKAPEHIQDISRWFGRFKNQFIQPAETADSENELDKDFLTLVFQFMKVKHGYTNDEELPRWLVYLKDLSEGKTEGGISLRLTEQEFLLILERLKVDRKEYDEFVEPLTESKRKRAYEVYKMSVK